MKQESCFDLPGAQVLSMGGGVQTTACLVKFGPKFDHVIFADTGDEHPETYEYIEKYLKPYCKEHDISWHTAKSERYDSLLDHCVEEKVQPSMARRWCTEEYKVKPINRKLKELGATTKKPFNTHIGISIDETHRLHAKAFVDKPKYSHKVYPLIENKISRSNCYQIIKDYGWPLPIKSGCDFCPFAGKREIRKLAVINPTRWKKIVDMERNSNMKIPLIGKYPLSLNVSLDEYMTGGIEEEAMCDSGHCFV